MAALQDAGTDCFLDTEDIAPLADFPERVRQGIDASHALLAWWSADYAESDHCLAEFRRAWQHARRRSSDVGRRVWVLNPEPTGHHVFAGELSAKNFLVLPPTKDVAAWARGLKERLDALVPEGLLADERGALESPALRNLPTPNRSFTGRGATVLRVHSALFPPQIGGRATAAGVYLHGMGGLGKTEVAAKYGHDFAHAFPGGVFWLSFAGFEPAVPLDEAAAKLAGYRALEATFAGEPELQATLLRDAEDKPRTPERAREAIARWFRDAAEGSEPRPYLWILDNVPHMSPQDARDRALAFWRAPTPAGRTLVTTRDARVAAGFIEERLEEFGEADALRLLSRFRVITDGERTAAEQLAAEVGRHTLALMLLGERVRRDGGYARTLATLQATGRLARLDQLAERLRGDLGAAARSVTATFEVSIRPLSSDARRLLALAAVCAQNEAIPRTVLRSAFGGDHEGDAFADAVNVLLGASLLGHRGGEDAVDIHPLVADAATHLLGVRLEREGEVVGEALLPRIADAHDIRRHPAVSAEIVHARLLAGRLESRVGVLLALRVGQYETARGFYGAARALGTRAVEVARRTLGSEHHNTLSSMNNLADALRAQGDLGEARGLIEEALPSMRRVLGPEHPDTLSSTSNLATVLQAQGDLAGARRLIGEILETQRRVLGPAHPATLTSMNNLSVVCGKLGDLAEARGLLEEALPRMRRVLGPDHPNTLKSDSGLAAVLYAQGDLAAARGLFEKVVAAQRRVLGPTHEDTTGSAWGLLHTLSDTSSAEQRRGVLRASLLWLLDADPESLSAQQRDIRERLPVFLEGSQRSSSRRKGSWVAGLARSLGLIR